MVVTTAAMPGTRAVCWKLFYPVKHTSYSKLELLTFNSHLECTETPQALQVFPCLLSPQMDDWDDERAVEETRRMHEYVLAID